MFNYNHATIISFADEVFDVLNQFTKKNKIRGISLGISATGPPAALRALILMSEVPYPPDINVNSYFRP